MAQFDKWTPARDGGQPVQGDDHAAATLAQGNDKCKPVPTAHGMKDVNAPGQKYTGR
jgi:hypothetical protein